MKISDRVKVKDAAGVDPMHRGKIGTVIADAAAGGAVEVEFDDETIPHSVNPADLEVL